MISEPVTPQCLQKVTVVVHVLVTMSISDVSKEGAVVSVGFGRVRVTVVGVGAQLSQTLTVVVQPSGIEGVVEAGPEGGFVTPAVAVASGQKVVVMVVVIVVKPVGQMSV